MAAQCRGFGFCVRAVPLGRCKAALRPVCLSCCACRPNPCALRTPRLGWCHCCLAHAHATPTHAALSPACHTHLLPLPRHPPQLGYKVPSAFQRLLFTGIWDRPFCSLFQQDSTAGFVGKCSPAPPPAGADACSKQAEWCAAGGPAASGDVLRTVQGVVVLQLARVRRGGCAGGGGCCAPSRVIRTTMAMQQQQQQRCTPSVGFSGQAGRQAGRAAMAKCTLPPAPASPPAAPPAPPGVSVSSVLVPPGGDGVDHRRRRGPVADQEGPGGQQQGHGEQLGRPHEEVGGGGGEGCVKRAVPGGRAGAYVGAALPHKPCLFANFVLWPPHRTPAPRPRPWPDLQVHTRPTRLSPSHSNSPALG